MIRKNHYTSSIDPTQGEARTMMEYPEPYFLDKAIESLPLQRNSSQRHSILYPSQALE